MKHSWKTTTLLLALFVVSQIIGIFIIGAYVGKTLPLGIERPDINPDYSFGYIFGSILIATLLLLVLIRYKKVRLWKLLFFISMTLVLTISLGAFLTETLAVAFALLLAWYKLFKPNPWIHNATEIILYGGLAALFVPMLNLFSASILLILLSLYDAYAVWKSKHMVKLAEFSKEANVFAGIIVGKMPQKIRGKAGTGKSRAALLGGGDIGFSLLFAGTVFAEQLSQGFSYAFWKSMIIVAGSTLALTLLFIYGKKDRYYPAMPFISLGCFLGLLFV